MNMRRASRNPRECAEAKDTLLTAQVERASRNPRECAVAKTKRAKAAAALAESQPARMRCGKAAWRKPGVCRKMVATRANALWQSIGVNVTCGKSIVATRTNALWQRPTAVWYAPCAWSQPARMRCGKVAPLLCPNRKLREHELRSSFLVSPPVILVVTFYMTAQLLKRFNRVQQKPPHQNCPMRRCILLISEPVSTEPAGIVGLFPLALCKIILNKFDWVIWQGLSTLFELSDAYRLSDFLLPLCCHETAAW